MSKIFTNFFFLYKNNLLRTAALDLNKAGWFLQEFFFIDFIYKQKM